MLFGFAPLGIPAMGAAGIALATVLIQAVSVVYMSSRARSLGSFSGATLQSFVPKLSTFREIAAQGIPAGLNMMTIALGMFIINFQGALFLQDIGRYLAAPLGVLAG